MWCCLRHFVWADGTALCVLRVSVQGFKSEEEKLQYFKDLGDPLAHPMFATDTADLEGNPLVEAIRAIKVRVSPAERAASV